MGALQAKLEKDKIDIEIKNFGNDDIESIDFNKSFRSQY